MGDGYLLASVGMSKCLGYCTYSTGLWPWSWLLVKKPWQAHCTTLFLGCVESLQSEIIHCSPRRKRVCEHLHYIQDTRLHTCIVSGGRHRLPSITQGQIGSIYHKLSNSQLGLELFYDCSRSPRAMPSRAPTRLAVIDVQGAHKMLRVYIIYDRRCLSHPHLIPRRSKKACNSLKIFAKCTQSDLVLANFSHKCSYLQHNSYHLLKVHLSYCMLISSHAGLAFKTIGSLGSSNLPCVPV